VDDDRESLKMLDALRAAQGARVTTAGTAKEASALVGVNQFGPIVSDIGSPAWTDPRCSASCARCIARPHGRKRALAAGSTSIWVSCLSRMHSWTCYPNSEQQLAGECKPTLGRCKPSLSAEDAELLRLVSFGLVGTRSCWYHPACCLHQVHRWSIVAAPTSNRPTGTTTLPVH
jgi:hypothetical protein